MFDMLSNKQQVSPIYLLESDFKTLHIFDLLFHNDFSIDYSKSIQFIRIYKTDFLKIIS